MKYSPAQIGRKPWHATTADETLRELDSRREGLTGEDVGKRQQRFGLNRLPERKRAGMLSVFLRQFKNPLIYILLIAGAVSLTVGSYSDAIFIFAVLLLNAVIGTFQEYKAETSAEALKSFVEIRAKVRREGRRREVDSSELVPGDIVLLESGVSVPADIRLLSAKQLRVDESLLTGESTPVDKNPEAELSPDAALGDRVNLVHAGSSVLEGRGRGVVCRTAEQTEVGRIADSLSQEGQLPPLVLRLRRFTRNIAALVLAAIAILASAKFVQGAAVIEIFMLAVALAVSAIPAGLPVAITVALSIASNRMAKRNVIVRMLPAVEGLGACTLIASDKTGTLTANRLTVRRLHLPEAGDIDVTGRGLDPEGELRQGEKKPSDEALEKARHLAIAGALCNEGDYRIENGQIHQQGDTVDVALLVLATKLGMPQESLQGRYPEIHAIPFESARRFAATFNRHDDEIVVHVKGATEQILSMCEQIDRENVDATESRLANEGFRVIAVAEGQVDEQTANTEDPELKGLNFLGLVALRDPIRSEVPDAVERCHEAGVEVRMITGDHPATGRSIARELSIAGEDPKEVITGSEIGALVERDQELDARIGQSRVFARVEPRQKTTIVESLQRLGHFVAVTGDGVNDAPALRKAHIGVAMGRSGTDVARGAADLILTDDNFASIVNGIEEGRIAYDNVRKVTWLLISTGASEIVLFFLAMFTGMPLPLDPVQLLWLNLVTNGIQDVALAFERGEPGVLKRRPRPPDQPIFDRLMIEETLLSGLWIGIVAFGLFYVLKESGQFSEFEARNLLLLLMVLFENAHIFNCRSERRSVFDISLHNNWLLVGTVVLAQTVHIGAMYVPGVSHVLGIQPVTLLQWLVLLPIALSIILVVELYKQLRGRTLSRSIP